MSVRSLPRNPLSEAIDMYAAATRPGERLVAISRLERQGQIPAAQLVAGEMCLEMAQRGWATFDERSELLKRTERDWKRASRPKWGCLQRLPVNGRSLIQLALLPQYEAQTLQGRLLPRPQAQTVYDNLLSVGQHYLDVLGIFGERVIDIDEHPEIRAVGGDIPELELILLGQRKALKRRTRSPLRGKNVQLSFFSQDCLEDPSARYDIAVVGENDSGALEVTDKIQAKSGFTDRSYDDATVTVVSTRYDLRLSEEKGSGRKRPRPLRVGTILRELVEERDNPSYTHNLDRRGVILGQMLAATAVRAAS